MNDFPEFMKSPANRIATTSQATPGVEGYDFDGADGSQMAFWTCHETAALGDCAALFNVLGSKHQLVLRTSIKAS